MAISLHMVNTPRHLGFHETQFDNHQSIPQPTPIFCYKALLILEALGEEVAQFNVASLRQR